ncbi:DUF4192 family protein [Agromyces bauzanensis]
MTTIIRAGAAHDFLAIVPALTGYAPVRSLVCVAFHGNRSAGVLRFDLPRRARDRETLASVVVGTVCRMPGVDAIVPVVYTEAAFARRGAMPERALLELVVARAEAAGFLVRDALCVAADGWGSVLDPETPAQGHPLDLIASSPAASTAACRRPRRSRRPRDAARARSRSRRPGGPHARRVRRRGPARCVRPAQTAA